MSKSRQPATRGAHKQDKRERIRQAAWELFCSDGYDGTTTRAVAARARVAVGTVFLYAPDKVDLLFLVMHDRLAATVDEAFGSLPRKAPVLDQWMHLFGKLFRMYGEQPGVSAAFVRAVPGAQGPNADRVNALTFAFIHRVASLLVEAQQRHEVATEIAPLMAAQNVFFLYFGSLTVWLSGMTTLDGALEMHLRPSLALFIRGLRP